MTAYGTLYIRDTCIACDNCTRIAPDYFALDSDYLSVSVRKQPTSNLGIDQCNNALKYCPVQAIGRQKNNYA